MAFSWDAGNEDLIPFAVNRPGYILGDWFKYQVDMQKMDDPVVLICG